MFRSRHLFYSALALLWLSPASGQGLSDVEQLGKSIFFDEALSINVNQSCASCHGPGVGWTGPIEAINESGGVYEGSIAGRFGARKPPSSAYAAQSPIFAWHRQGGGLFLGGNFWDGRATGEKLGNPAADQAQGPFLNPVEQALPDNACVVYFVCNGAYPIALEDVWGADACDIAWPVDVLDECATEGGMVDLSDADAVRVEASYDQIALSIAAYESSAEVNAFTSKYDAFLARAVDLTEQEREGLRLFNGKAKCSRCHTSKAKHGEPPLFTDYSYDNLGTPRNPDNPVYGVEGDDWVDTGLGGFLAMRPEYAGMAEEHMGAQKVPTLRNVDLRPDPGFTKAFGHNGYFKTLWQIVHFYNTRDVKPACPNPFTPVDEAIDQGCWPEAEVEENVNDSELGDLKLTLEQEHAIVAFLKTLSDGYFAGAAPAAGPAAMSMGGHLGAMRRGQGQ
jgi:cytochrome c peroxidase